MLTRIRASVVVPDLQGRILLYKQTSDLWCIPGGGVEDGESVPEAALRGAKEETGLDVRLIRPLWVDSQVGDRHHLDIIYLAEAVDERTATLSEECRFFGLDEMRGIQLYPRWFVPAWLDWIRFARVSPWPVAT